MLFSSTNRKEFSIEVDLDAPSRAGYVVSPPHHQPHDVVVQLGHFELVQVRLEGHLQSIQSISQSPIPLLPYLSEVRFSGLDDLCILVLSHVLHPGLFEGLAVLLGRRLDSELSGEDVAEFGSVTVSASSHLQ